MAAARAAADAAVKLAGPPSAGLAGAARFLCEPPAPASEWALRAERAFASPAAAPMKGFVLACALLRGRHFDAAVPLLREIYARWTHGADPGIPVMYASALAGSARLKEAAPLVERYPVPRPSEIGPFTPMWFPRLLLLRAQVLESRGRVEQARAARQLYQTLGGGPGG
jgi:hypothetical protein